MTSDLEAFVGDPFPVNRPLEQRANWVDLPSQGLHGGVPLIGDLMISSGFASAFRISYAVVPGISPYAGWSGSIFSATILGTGVPPGVEGLSSGRNRDDARLLWPSGMTSTSSGTASFVLSLYAAVPGTSPSVGWLSTFSSLVFGTGEVSPECGNAPGWSSDASINCSLSSDDPLMSGISGAFA